MGEYSSAEHASYCSMQEVTLMFENIILALISLLCLSLITMSLILVHFFDPKTYLCVLVSVPGCSLLASLCACVFPKLLPPCYFVA